MVLKISSAVADAMLNAIETNVGTAAKIRLKSGAPPTNCAAADTGTVLASIDCASDWMGASSGGIINFNNLPLSDPNADAAGTLGHYRVYKSDGTTCVMQGTITATGGGGDMTVDSVTVALNQPINITAWSMNLTGHVA